MENLDYEVVQKHEYQDIYRLKYGVLMIVKKFKYSDYDWCFRHTNKNELKLTKIKGIKNCYKTKEDIVVHDDVLPRGSVILDHEIILITSDEKDFFYELKTTGSNFSGDRKEFQILLGTIQNILNNY